jgi:heat shock protein HslJ
MINQLTGSNLRKGLLAVTTILIIAVTMAARKPSVAEEGIDLDGTSWILVAIDGEAVIPGSEITMKFEDGQIGGSAGVNGYFASYEADGASLTFGPAGSTMMMGPEDLMAQEMSFLSALGSAGSFSVDGEALEILSEGGNLLFTTVK